MEPLRPWTVTVNGATPVVQVTDTSPVALTDCVQPAGAVEVSENVTAPVNPLIVLTATCDVPAVFAVVVIAGADSVKSWTVTKTPTVRVIEPLTPWTVTVNGATPVVHVTDTRPAVLIDCVHPAGAVDVSENVTAPANPLIAVTATCDVPAVLAVVVIAGAESVKSCTVTRIPTVRVIAELTP
jgi:hypothetical protein